VRLRSNIVVNAVRRATVVLVVIGIGVSVVIGGYLRFWRSLTIDASALKPRPPKAVETPLWDDGSPRDIPCPPESATSAEPIEVGFCDIVSRPRDFACRRVRFRATVLSDCMHSTALIDSRCERGIAPEAALHDDHAVESFFEDICTEMPINFDVIRRATFTGRFRLRERNTATIFVLDVEAVRPITPDSVALRWPALGLSCFSCN
jgi:hypothetical protein